MPRARALAGQTGGEPGVVHDGGMVVEPVEVAGGGVEPEEVAGEPSGGGGRRLEVIPRGGQLRLVKDALAPAEPGEVILPATRSVGRDVEDAAVEGGLLHPGDVPPQERRVRLVPAELDQPLDRAIGHIPFPGPPVVAHREREHEADEGRQDRSRRDGLAPGLHEVSSRLPSVPPPRRSATRPPIVSQRLRSDTGHRSRTWTWACPGGERRGVVPSVLLRRMESCQRRQSETVQAGPWRGRIPFN